MKTQTVHFRVDPDGLTRLIRDIWAEGNYQKCLNILAAVRHGEPLPINVQYDIIRGKKRLARYRNDPNSLCIKSDDWEPRHVDYYPDPQPDKLAAYLKKRADEESERQINRAMRGMVPTPDEDEAEPSPRSLGMKKFAGYDSLEEMNLAFAFKKSVPTPEQMIETMRSRDEREEQGKPTHDATLAADMAWVAPNGNFYACLTPMEHIWLVGQFDMTETQAEAKGWIKITRDFVGKRFVHLGRKEATQRQINTVFDWCEKHDYPLPEWAGKTPSNAPKMPIQPSQEGKEV